MEQPKLLFAFSVFIYLVLSGRSQTSSELDNFKNSTLENDTFIGAVIEYGGSYTGTGKEQVLFNLEQYAGILHDISSQVANISIVVFPEVGLQRILGSDTVNIYGEPVPQGSDNVTPCITNDETVALKKLSCLAKEYSTYLVVNLIERNTDTNGTSDYYNTNVVFNRNGTIIARYRKFNIYGIDGKPLKKPSTPDLIYFDTDFGVRFGTFTCFDIAFQTPALDLVQKHNITHFVFPVAWISELPFLTALQMQAGWAHANNVVLMAAGLNDPPSGSTGSGVYAGSSVIRAYQTSSSKNFAVIAKIPKSLTDLKGKLFASVLLALNSTKQTPDKLELLEDRTDVYSNELLVENQTYIKGDGVLGLGWRSSRAEVENRKICYGKFCCNFTLNFTVFYRDPIVPHYPSSSGDGFGANEYQLLAFDGVRSYGGGIATGGIKTCAVVSCIDSDVNSCSWSTYNSSQKVIVFNTWRKFIKTDTIFHEIKVEAEVENTDGLFIMPDTLSRNIGATNRITGTQFGKLDDSFIFKKEISSDGNITKVSMSTTSELKNIGTFGIYARVFSRDGMNASDAPYLPPTSTEKPQENKGNSLTLQATALLFIPLIYYPINS